MNKVIKMTAFAVVLGAVSTASLAADTGAFFINANIGQSDFHDRSFSNHTDTTTAARAGYVWHVGDSSDIGVEAGYVGLGRASGSVSVNTTTVNLSTKLSGPLLGANFKYKFSNKIFVSVRGGWFHPHRLVELP